MAVATTEIGLGSWATPQTAEIGICYQTGTGAVANFAGSNYIIHRISNERRGYSASASITGLSSGTYPIGMGIKNNGGSAAITDNDWVNGFVVVSN